MAAHATPLEHRLDVLVVDADPEARRRLRRELEQLGHACRFASSGGEALEMHATRPADVFLSAAQLPDMQCDELCQRLRAADGSSLHTHFIFLTDAGDHALVPRGMNAGADDHQERPIDLPELEGRLISAARMLTLHRTLALGSTALLDMSTVNAASLSGAALQQRMSDEVSQMFAAARRYKRRCCIAACAVEHVAALRPGGRAAVLDEAAERAQGALRASDAFFRLTASEFLIVLPEQTLKDSMIAIHRVRDRIAELQLTLSIGMSQLEPFDTTADAWVSRTERALMHARSVGGGVIAIDA